MRSGSFAPSFGHLISCQNPIKADVDWFKQIGGNVGQSGPSAFAVSSSYADVLSAQASRDCVAKYSLHIMSITQESIFACNGTDGCTLMLECYRHLQSFATEQVSTVGFENSFHPKRMPAAAAAFPTNFITCGPPDSYKCCPVWSDMASQCAATCSGVQLSGSR